ncbi:MAG: CoxG family protein [Nitrospinota bacterium]
MILEGRFDVGTPASKAWDFLMDLDRLAPCLPGLEEVTQSDDRTFDGMIGASVGPMSGKFSFRATILESTPPTELLVRTEGTDSVTKSTVSTNVKLTLAETGDNRTELRYRADVDIRGRLAIVGDMILRAAANVVLAEFAKRFRSRVEG